MKRNMSSLVNLLAETVEALEEHGKCPGDVAFLSTSNGSLTWTQYAASAKDIEYDAGYGLNCISMDLMVVGDGWWLERYEYDGSECWCFKSTPTPPTEDVKDDEDILDFLKM